MICLCSKSLKFFRTSKNGLNSAYFAKIALKIAKSKYFSNIFDDSDSPINLPVSLDYSVIKAYRSSVQCKCKLRCLLQLTEGGHSYIIEDMDVHQGLSNPYPFQTKISAKILDPLQANGKKLLKLCTLKRRKMNF